MTQEEKQSILTQLVRPYKHYINQKSLPSIITHTEYTIKSAWKEKGGNKALEWAT